MSNTLSNLESLSVACVSTVTLLAIITSPFRKRIERKIDEWDSMVRVVHDELVPNGGGSLKDQVTRIDDRLKRVEDVANAGD